MAVFLTACGDPTPVRTLPGPAVSLDGCLGTGLADVTLAGDPNDPRLAWLLLGGAERIEVEWPPGFAARFVPNLEVLNASGQVVVRDGDLVTEGCGMELKDGRRAIYIDPPFADQP